MAKTMTKETKWQGWAILGTLAVFVAKALVVLVSTPIFLGMWLLNFFKTLLGTAIVWVLGKFAIILVGTGILEFLFNQQWITEEKGDAMITWLSYHLGGSSQMGFNVAPEGAVNLFSYPKIEFTLIVLFALVTATMMTITPDKM
ncbi:UNVERIFIED_CONTAM: hypothetical protein KB574_09360 [Streptococcus canis]